MVIIYVYLCARHGCKFERKVYYLMMELATANKPSAYHWTHRSHIVESWDKSQPTTTHGPTSAIQ